MDMNIESGDERRYRDLSDYLQEVKYALEYNDIVYMKEVAYKMFEALDSKQKVPEFKAFTDRTNNIVKLAQMLYNIGMSGDGLKTIK